MENSLRQYVVEQFSTIFGVGVDDALCSDLEKCIVRHSKRTIESTKRVWRRGITINSLTYINTSFSF